MKKSQNTLIGQEESVAGIANMFTETRKVVSEVTKQIKQVSLEIGQLSRNAKTAGGSIINIASIAEESAAGTEEESASIYEQAATINDILTHAEKSADMAQGLNNSIESFKL